MNKVLCKYNSSQGSLSSSWSLDKAGAEVDTQELGDSCHHSSSLEEAGFGVATMVVIVWGWGPSSSKVEMSHCCNCCRVKVRPGGCCCLGMLGMASSSSSGEIEVEKK